MAGKFLSILLLVFVVGSSSGVKISNFSLKSGSKFIDIIFLLGRPEIYDVLVCDFETDMILVGESATVSFYQDEVLLKTEKNVVVRKGKGRSELELNNINRDTAGIYECEVTVAEEVGRKEFELIVIERKSSHHELDINYSGVDCQVDFSGSFDTTYPETVSFCGITAGTASSQHEKKKNWLQGPQDEPLPGQPTWAYSSVLKQWEKLEQQDGFIQYSLNKSAIMLSDLPRNESLIAVCQQLVMNRKNNIVKVLQETSKLLATNENMYLNHCPALPFEDLAVHDFAKIKYGFHQEQDCWGNWLADAPMKSSVQCEEKELKLEIGCHKDLWYILKKGQKINENSVQFTKEAIEEFKGDCCGAGPNHCSGSPFEPVLDQDFLQPHYSHHSTDCENNWYCQGDIKSDLQCLKEGSGIYGKNLTIVCHGDTWFKVKEGRTDGALDFVALSDFNATCSGADDVTAMLLPLLIASLLFNLMK